MSMPDGFILRMKLPCTGGNGGVTGSGGNEGRSGGGGGGGGGSGGKGGSGGHGPWRLLTVLFAALVAGAPLMALLNICHHHVHPEALEQTCS